MAAALSIVVLVAIIAAYMKYGSWLTDGIRKREFETAVPASTLQRLFAERVARSGWKIVDDGNPMVAQSSLATGVRQQIGLALFDAGGGRTRVEIGPHRWITKHGVPKKGHTIRMRLDAFVDAVQRQDPAVQVRLVAASR